MDFGRRGGEKEKKVGRPRWIRGSRRWTVVASMSPIRLGRTGGAVILLVLGSGRLALQRRHHSHPPEVDSVRCEQANQDSRKDQLPNWDQDLGAHISNAGWWKGVIF